MTFLIFRWADMNHITSTACCHLSRYTLSDHRRKFSFCLCDQGLQVFGEGTEGKARILAKSYLVQQIHLVKQNLLCGKSSPNPFQWFPLCVFGSLKTGFLFNDFSLSSLRLALICPPLALGREVCLPGCRI